MAEVRGDSLMCDHERPVFGCDDCIARANVGMTLEQGAKTFRVEAERTLSSTFYIVAATKKQAEEEAEELVDTLDNTDYVEADTSCFVTDGTPGDNDAVWSGGPKGGWSVRNNVRRLRA